MEREGGDSERFTSRAPRPLKRVVKAPDAQRVEVPDAELVQAREAQRDTPLGASNKGFLLLRKMGWAGGGVGAQAQVKK